MQNHILHGTSESLSRKDFDGPSYTIANAGSAPMASAKLNLSKGPHRIRVFCVPTHAIHEGRGLRIAITINGGDSTLLDVHTPSKTGAWKQNVIQGYSAAETSFGLDEDGVVNLQMALLDPGVAVTKIVIY